MAAATAKALTMATRRANARKQGQRLKAIARANLLLKLKSKQEPLIPAKILKQLADLHLPNNPWVYNVCLRELLRG